MAGSLAHCAFDLWTIAADVVASVAMLTVSSGSVSLQSLLFIRRGHSCFSLISTEKKNTKRGSIAKLVCVSCKEINVMYTRLRYFCSIAVSRCTWRPFYSRSRSCGEKKTLSRCEQESLIRGIYSSPWFLHFTVPFFAILCVEVARSLNITAVWLAMPICTFARCSLPFAFSQLIFFEFAEAKFAYRNRMDLLSSAWWLIDDCSWCD